jgi:hypothetical protein
MAMEKFGNLVVNMVFELGENIVFVYMLYSHVHTHLAPRTLIKFLFLIRLIMPQVKNLKRYCWIIGNSIYSQPSPWG